MLRLLVLRHAKAVAEVGGDDAARALTTGGKADAHRLGVFLKEQGVRPDRVLVSPATRTRQTWESVGHGLGGGLAATIEPALYSATASQIRALVADTPQDVATLMVIGHNPAVMELALTIADSGAVADFEAMRRRFPPCSLVLIKFEGATWADAADGHGRLERFVTPDLLQTR